jgi:hypothetical protein
MNKSTAPLSPLRHRLLQLAYLILGGGLAVTLWPDLLSPGQDWERMTSVVKSMLAAISLLALVGLFRPLQMLPVLLFEFSWKMIWLLRMALPLWLEGPLDADTAQTVFDCLLILPVMALIPWDYVWHNIFAAKGEA